MHVDGFSGAYRLEPIDVRGVKRQWQQAWLLFSESLGHPSCATVRPRALVGNCMAPRQRLAMAVRHEGKARPLDANDPGTGMDAPG